MRSRCDLSRSALSLLLSLTLRSLTVRVAEDPPAAETALAVRPPPLDQLSWWAPPAGPPPAVSGPPVSTQWSLPGRTAYRCLGANCWHFLHEEARFGGWCCLRCFSYNMFEKGHKSKSSRKKLHGERCERVECTSITPRWPGRWMPDFKAFPEETLDPSEALDWDPHPDLVYLLEVVENSY